jgi:aminomethyltransferase
MSQDAATLKRTPVHDRHLALAAKMVPFGGWDMPVQYSGIIEEHQAVRQAAGLFDVSHMGEFRVEGDGAEAFVQKVVANDVSKLAPDQALYTQFTRPDGGTVDDLLVYRQPDGFLLVVNASNIGKDWDWLQSHKPDDVYLTDESDKTAMLALQGPKAAAILAPLVKGGDVTTLKGFHWLDAVLGRYAVRIARTGYTGEDGFEIFCTVDDAPRVWKALLEAGESQGLKPAGLGARDTLRLEAGLPLYGHELTDTLSPVQAGFGWSVKVNKGDFLGRDVLARQKQGELSQKVVGLRMAGRQIARQDYAVMQGDKRVGTVLSGTFSPTLQAPIATALVDTSAIASGQPLTIEIRNQQYPADIVPMPFYRRSS